VTLAGGWTTAEGYADLAEVREKARRAMRIRAGKEIPFKVPYYSGWLDLRAD